VSAAAGPFRYKAPVRRNLLFLIGVALAVVALDQWTKYLVVDELTSRLEGRSGADRVAAFYSKGDSVAGPDGYHFRQWRAINLSDQFLRLRYAENPGAAWGLFRTLPEQIRGPLFHFVSIGAVVLITYYFLKLTGSRSEKWAFWGLPLVMGGAVGNYLDRLARGFVVDFIEAHYLDRAAWPSFNVADSAICVGVGMLVLDAILRREGKRSPAPAR